MNTDTGILGAKKGDIIYDSFQKRTGVVTGLSQSGNEDIVIVRFVNKNKAIIKKINTMEDAQMVGRYYFDNKKGGK